LCYSGSRHWRLASSPQACPATSFNMSSSPIIVTISVVWISSVFVGHTTPASCHGQSRGQPIDQQRNLDLLQAAEQGNALTIGKLLEQGADKNAQDNNRVSCLMKAVQSGKTEAAWLLLEKRADPNHIDKDGYTPLMEAANTSAAMCTLLLKYKANVNPKLKANGAPPLMIASLKPDVAGMSVLLEAGAKVNARTADGTALHILMHQVSASTFVFADTGYDLDEKSVMKGLELLLRWRADVNARDRYGATPLMFAAKGCNPRFVRVLLAKGAKASLKDSTHRAALDYARQHKDHKEFSEVEGLLVAATSGGSTSVGPDAGKAHRR
jgi:ankyrin repeat protein